MVKKSKVVLHILLNSFLTMFEIIICQIYCIPSGKKRRDCDQHDLGSKPACVILCVFAKNTLRHFPLLAGLGKQF